MRGGGSLPASPEVLRELIEFDPETGSLIWRQRDVEWFYSPGHAAAWNRRHAGKPALNVHSRDGYRRGYMLHKQCLAHRVAWAIHYGEAPDFEIDHINGDPADNRITNLRASDPQTNNRNLAKPKNNTSGTVGVAFIPGRWRATITVDNQTKHLGYFETEAEAIEARKAAERKYGFHENHGRDFVEAAA